ncbi:MAG TPA: triple tyrosine motif-containing protein [Chitinophagaceae bacterium]
MQRTSTILAYFFVCASCFAQQYPFVHYSPKDGLISNQIRNIFQDSKGRLYFTSLNGLSIYDGSRFTNYNSKNGLHNDIVNCVMEMGDDSVWLVTNDAKINCLVKGKMNLLALKEKDIVINSLYKDEKGGLYAATEQGLHIFDNDHFTKLPFTDIAGNDINFQISYIIPAGDYFLIQRDYSLLHDQKNELYLYNKLTKKTSAELPWIFSINTAPDGRIWVSTEKKIMAIDTAALKNGEIVLRELPDKYSHLRNFGRFIIQFDRANNCWLGNQSNILIKVSPEGKATPFTSASGLAMFYINSVFMDREGITWIATNNAGVHKLVNSNFSLTENFYNTPPPLSDIFYNPLKDQWLIYSWPNHSLVLARGDKPVYFKTKPTLEADQIAETPDGIFALGRNHVYKLTLKDNWLYEKIILSDTGHQMYSRMLVDKNGALIICGKNKITSIVNGKKICQKKLNYFADVAAADSKGNIWVVTRAGDVTMYHTRPGDPLNYLEEKFHFKKELAGISPRSFIIDKNDKLWIGSRSNGIHVFALENERLQKQLNITTASGLSDDFITYLTCDDENNIWASSFLGLDKIEIDNATPIVENLTRQNNIYQSVFKVVIDRNNVAWGIVSNGIIRITPGKKKAPDYSPTLMISLIKTGKDTIPVLEGRELHHRQNNISFYFAATSYFDEKQVLYSYRLLDGKNNQWSEPSNNATVSFIGLPPGDYRLELRASFPASRYPDKAFNYGFTIAPAWWQTWWFRSLSGVFIIGLFVFAFRFYYRRKLEKEMALLEKQQAIEKERTRIATDMHDDLGAGLSRIKFLSETIGIKKQQQQPIEEEVSKIREYSHEMIDKMGEIVWALNEKNDSLSDLLSYTRAYTVEYLSQNGIVCAVDAPEQFPAGFVSGEFRRNIYLTVKEALHNIVKHAQASNVLLSIAVNHQLSISIKDNGTGFDINRTRAFSNGLMNMKARIGEIKGHLEIINGDGTLVNIKVPLPK